MDDGFLLLHEVTEKLNYNEPHTSSKVKLFAPCREGVQVSMEFFDDIIIPGPHKLQDPSFYKEEEQVLWEQHAKRT